MAILTTNEERTTFGTDVHVYGLKLFLGSGLLWAQSCHESASLPRHFKCQRRSIYGSLAKGPSISVSFQLYRGLGGWHGGTVGGARVHSAARLRLDWPSCFQLRIELQWFPRISSDEGC
jgi:hypothetical protein